MSFIYLPTLAAPLVKFECVWQRQEACDDTHNPYTASGAPGKQHRITPDTRTPCWSLTSVMSEDDFSLQLLWLCVHHRKRKFTCQVSLGCSQVLVPDTARNLFDLFQMKKWEEKNNNFDSTSIMNQPPKQRLENVPSTNRDPNHLQNLLGVVHHVLMNGGYSWSWIGWAQSIRIGLLLWRILKGTLACLNVIALLWKAKSSAPIVFSTFYPHCLYFKIRAWSAVGL